MPQPDPRIATRTHPAFLALGCVGFIASAPAAAQSNEAASADAPKTFKGVTVTGTAITDEGYKAERIESPKAVAPLLDTPRSIVVVDKQIIKDTGSATLVDALRTVPGITFGAAEGGNPIGDRPFIRGFDSQGSTYLDGVRDIGAQTREVFAVEQIQIVRGSDSTLGGRGSAGGSLNVISKLPERETFIAGSGSYGTADYKRLTGDVNYRLSDSIAFRVNGAWHDQDIAGRDAIFQKRWGIAPSVTIGMNSKTRLTLAYYHLHTNELPDSGIPYLYACSTTVCNAPNGYTLSQPALGKVTTASGTTGYVGRDTFYGLKDRDFRHSNTDQATMRIEHDFGTVKLRNTSRYSHTYQEYIFLLPDDSTGNVYGNPANLTGQPGGQVWRRANTRFGYTDSIINQTDLYGTFETGSIKHSFSVGGELSWEKSDRGAYVLATGSTISPRCSALAIARFYCTSLFTPNPNDAWQNYTNDTAAGTLTAITKGASPTHTINNANTKSVYAFDSITLTDKLILNLGARYDDFKSKVTLPFFLIDRPIVRRDDGIFNWQAGAVFKPTPNTSFYASYATAAIPPNSLIGEGQEQNSLGTLPTTTTAATYASAVAALQAAANDALKVEKTKSMEIGGKAELLDGALSINAAIFQTKSQNSRAIASDGTVQFIGAKRVRGIELGFNGNITDKWNVFGGYSYLDARITDGGFTALTVAANGAAAATTVAVPSVNTGRRFPQTAKHNFTIWTDYKVTSAFSIGGGAFYVSRVYGGYGDNRTATQTTAGVITVTPATKTIARSIPGYWRFDARAGYKINDHVDVSVNVQNLTNKTYFSQAYTSHYATLAASRSAFATVNFRY
ncbi:catecholate siderophore receptor [Sphingomonas sp. YR710]|uniref:TonB-dependent receptor n=1 Tax=Sphingomonas sp. YR710 TaxID=1882773 RepID=UPI000888DD8E|nr:TonB-dependent receptor [Sphingomonas sp. YR710]SDD53387.1 catecholate siderophore receptor [Sphingomonas sp. YR710]